MPLRVPSSIPPGAVRTSFEEVVHALNAANLGCLPQERQYATACLVGAKSALAGFISSRYTPDALKDLSDLKAVSTKIDSWIDDGVPDAQPTAPQETGGVAPLV